MASGKNKKSKGHLIAFIINGISLFVVSYLLEGITFTDLTALLVATLVIGIINTFIRPILKLIALPITIITFGLFSLVINIFLFYLASVIVPGFEIDGLVTATLASLLLSIVSWFIGKIVR